MIWNETLLSITLWGKKKKQPIHEQGIMASNITDLIPYSIQFDHHVTVFKR